MNETKIALENLVAKEVLYNIGGHNFRPYNHTPYYHSWDKMECEEFVKMKKLTRIIKNRHCIYAYVPWVGQEQISKHEWTSKYKIEYQQNLKKIETISDVFNEIENLQEKEQKTILQLLGKLFEEGGELAEEILIEDQAPGCTYKSPGDDGTIGECVDVMIVTACLAYKCGATTEDLVTNFEKKINKWKEVSLKDKNNGR